MIESQGSAQPQFTSLSASHLKLHRDWVKTTCYSAMPVKSPSLFVRVYQILCWLVILALFDIRIHPWAAALDILCNSLPVANLSTLPSTRDYDYIEWLLSDRESKCLPWKCSCPDPLYTCCPHLASWCNSALRASTQPPRTLRWTYAPHVQMSEICFLKKDNNNITDHLNILHIPPTLVPLNGSLGSWMKRCQPGNELEERPVPSCFSRME